MAIEVICTCGTKQRVPSSAEGTEVKCIRCGNLVLVTLEPQVSHTAAAPPAAMPLSERKIELENYTITAKFQREYAGEVDHLLKTVAASVGINASSADGLRVKVGWSVLSLRQRVQDLFLYEPDFTADPHRDGREDLSTTLRVMAMQAKLPRMLPGAKLIGCSCFDTIQVPDGVFENRKLFLRRIKAPIHSESGLYLSWTDPLELLKEKEPEETRNMETYLLLKERSAVLQALGLPSEYVAEFEGNDLTTIYGLKNKVIWKLH